MATWESLSRTGELAEKFSFLSSAVGTGGGMKCLDPSAALVLGTVRVKVAFVPTPQRMDDCVSTPPLRFCFKALQM